MIAHYLHHRGLHGLVISATGQGLNQIRPQVGGHHHHRIAEIHRTALTIGQAAIIQHLQQDVEDIRVSLLHLVQQYHRVRLATHRFGQVTAFFIADIAWGSPHQPGHGMLLHELGHVDTHHGFFGIEQEVGQCFTQLGLANPRGTQEQETAVGTIGVRQPGTGTTHRVGNGFHGFVLPHHPAMQGLFHAQQLVALALQHLGHRNPGPLGNDLGNFLVGDLVTQQLVLGLGLLLFLVLSRLHLLLQIRDHAVLQLGHTIQVTRPARLLQLYTGLLQLRLVLLGTLQGRFFRLPDFFQVGILFFQFVDVAFELFKTLLAGLIFLFAQGFTFHLELNQTTIKTVHFFRHGINFHADTTARLVNQIDGLVRQLTVGDIAVTQTRRGNDGAVGNVHTMVHFVALFQATQNGNGVFHGGLIHLHLLEATLQGGIFFNVLAILIQRGRPDTMQLAAGQRGLEHVAGIHGTFALASADHGMQLINEQDDAPLLLRQLVEHRLEALFEFTPVFGTGDQRRHIQRQHLLVLESLRHLAIDDALGQPLDDRGLAHTGLTDQHRVILGTTLQHLDRAANLIVAANHRIELAGLGALGEIHGVFVQCFALVFCVGIIDGFPATHFRDLGRQHLLGHTGVLEQLAQLTVVITGRQQHHLGREILVTILLGFTVGQVQQPAGALPHLHITIEIAHRGQFVHGHVERGHHIRRIGSGFFQQGFCHAPLLLHQCQHQVNRFNSAIALPHGQGLRIRQGFLQPRSEFVHSHS